MTEPPPSLRVRSHATLVRSLQQSIWADNGNFIDRPAVVPSQTTTTGTGTGTDGDSDGLDLSPPPPPPPPPPTQQQQQQLPSTYDYLYSQWREAIGPLSWKEDTGRTPDTGTNHRTTTNHTTGTGNTANYNTTTDTDPTATISQQQSFFDWWFQQLWNRHTTYATRFYHTVVHLEELCWYWQLILQHQHQPEPPTQQATTIITTSTTSPNETVKNDDPQRLSIQSLVLLSIFFHDAIYDPHSSTNEEDSATLFETSFAQQTNLHPAHVQVVVTYILATKHHTIPTDTSTITVTSSIDDDDDDDTDSIQLHHPLCLFLDLDMSVLGKNPGAYHQYAILIRNEYSFVPPLEYCQKRAALLEHFLSQSKRIYQTTLFYDALEQRARRNIQQEIQSLRQGILPS